MTMKINFNFDLEKWNNFKKDKNFKNSDKRKLVIMYFLKNDKHYSAEELYEEMKKDGIKISFSTIYRTLKILKESGIANELVIGDGFIRFEPAHNGIHHDHLICEKCGKIIEFFDDVIERMQEFVAKKYKFKIKSHRLEIFGLCDKCRRKYEKGT